MRVLLPTRRWATGGLLAALTFLPTLARAEATVPGQTFRGVAVDVGPLIDHGGGNTARAFAQVLEGQLRTVFADRITPGAGKAPLLTARITNLYLSGYADRTASFAFGNNDNIAGDGLVVVGGRVLSTTHILTELPPSYSGPPNAVGIDEARLRSIAYQFAYWLRREMAL